MVGELGFPRVEALKASPVQSPIAASINYKNIEKIK
jgi:hypothetical protein